eukprot:gene9179-biopygen1262
MQHYSIQSIHPLLRRLMLRRLMLGRLMLGRLMLGRLMLGRLMLSTRRNACCPNGSPFRHNRSHHSLLELPRVKFYYSSTPPPPVADLVVPRAVWRRLLNCSVRLWHGRPVCPAANLGAECDVSV